MNFYVNRVRFFAPGDEMPDVGFIPSMQRRKMSRLTRLVLGIAQEIVTEGKEYPLVYASRFGEWRQTLEQMLHYFKEKEISPAGFGYSVHNTAAGQLSILKGNHKTYTAISGAEHTFDAGMLEAVAMLLKEEEIIYLCVSEEAPEPYNTAFTESITEFAIGLRMGRVQTDSAAIPVTIDFAARNSVSGCDFSRAKDFVRFLETAVPSFSGSHYTLAQ